MLFMDGMWNYSAGADLSLVYTCLGTPTYSASGWSDGRPYVSPSTYMIRTFSTPATLSGGGKMHASFNFRTATAPGSPGRVFQFLTDLEGTAGGNGPGLYYNSNGSVFVTQHGGGATAATSPIGLLSLSTEYNIEYAAKWATNANGGFCKVWLDGNLVINFTGDMVSGTVPTTCTAFVMYPWISTNRYSQPVVWDESGTDFVTTQLSATYLPYIDSRMPTSNDAAQFTPSAGSNFQNVDDAGFHDGDSTYNSSVTVGHQDTFGLPAFGSTPAQVHCVAVKTIAKIDVAGLVNLRNVLKSGGSTGQSADHALTPSYVHYDDYFGKDPNGTIAWTASAAEAVKPGYKYQS